MGRFAESEELLGGMFFLTDDKAASAVTGVILPIDCGFAPNYQSEHEIMYSQQGIPIKFAIAVKGPLEGEGASQE